MSDIFSVIVEPIVTEKSARMAQDNQYVFAVDGDATKVQIREAVQKAFKVKVVDVRTINVKGKLKRRGWRFVRRTSVKKAIVTLAKGQQLDPSALA